MPLCRLSPADRDPQLAAINPCNRRPVGHGIADLGREDLKIVKLNVDDNPQTAASFEVLSIPTLILFRHGQVARKIIGAKPKKALQAELEPALA